MSLVNFGIASISKLLYKEAFLPFERDRIFTQQFCTHNCVTEKVLGFLSISDHLFTGFRTSLNLECFRNKM